MYCHLLHFRLSWFFFFKQKTADEMRISDWSSDVCSSDLSSEESSTPAAPVRSGSNWPRKTHPHYWRRPFPRFHGSGHLPIDEHGLRRPHSSSTNRSEEHTSELQSLMRISYAVFCLKKKKRNNKHIINTPLQIQTIKAK